MTTPRRWLEDPAAPSDARALVEALKSEPLPPARRERLFHGLVLRRVQRAPLWVAMLLGAAAAAGSIAVLNRPDPLEAETALFARGVSAQEERRPEAALALFRAYGRRYPRGALAAEARVECIDALMALGRQDEARQEARRFTSEFPRSSLLERAPRPSSIRSR